MAWCMGAVQYSSLLVRDGVFMALKGQCCLQPRNHLTPQAVRAPRDFGSLEWIVGVGVGCRACARICRSTYFFVTPNWRVHNIRCVSSLFQYLFHPRGFQGFRRLQGAPRCSQDDSRCFPDHCKDYSVKITQLGLHSHEDGKLGIRHEHANVKMIRKPIHLMNIYSLK